MNKTFYKSKKFIVAAITGVSLLGLAGTGVAIATVSQNSPYTIVTEDVKVSMKKAESIALKEVTNGTIVQSQLIQKNVPVYEIIVLQGGLQKQFDIDANTGKIVATRSGNFIRGGHGHGHGKGDHFNQGPQGTGERGPNTMGAPNANPQLPNQMPQPKLTAEQAKQIALESKPNSNFEKIELVIDNNKLFYDVNINEGGNSSEIRIDAENGTIIK